MRNIALKPDLKKNDNAIMKKTRFFFLLFVSLFSFFIFFPSCSSVPKKPVEIFTDRIMAANQLNLANQTANQGRFEDALIILGEARRLALSTDDPELRIKTAMSRGNILFSLGRCDEAFTEWENASAEGDSSLLPVLAGMARIYEIRASLVLLANGEAVPGNNGFAAGYDPNAAAGELINRLAIEMAAVKSDIPSTAAAYVTLGMAEKQLGRFTDAENTVRKALAIHDKSFSLVDAAYDWFIIASIRSVAGNYESALDALNQAISYDRRAENGFGLASSWQAMGEVYNKADRNEEAKTALRRAADIYRAIGLADLAVKAEAEMEG
ncbi:MAG: tetratricopeptide repeat protein [Treponema sp.]|nr:tetratricopeptide repeat protein [Treponema sp.]